MKPLLPTLKEKKRYVVYELVTKNPLQQAEEAVLSHLTKILGMFDSAKAGILAVRYDKKTQSGVLRVAHRSVDHVKAALLLLTHINNEKVVAHVLGVSGILKKTERFNPKERKKIGGE